MEGPANQIVVGAENGRFIISVLGRMHPDTTDYWDGNWLVSHIAVSVGGFSGRVRAGLRADELRRFRQELDTLYEKLVGSARLESMEDWLGLVFVADGLGHVAVTGWVKDEPGIGNELTFRLSVDQTHLPGILHSLRQVEAAYPVLGKP